MRRGHPAALCLTSWSPNPTGDLSLLLLKPCRCDRPICRLRKQVWLVHSHPAMEVAEAHADVDRS